MCSRFKRKKEKTMFNYVSKALTLWRKASKLLFTANLTSSSLVHAVQFPRLRDLPDADPTQAW